MLYEVITYQNHNDDLSSKVKNHLENVKQHRPEVAHLIDNGINLILEKEHAS